MSKVHAMVPARYGSTRLRLKNLCMIDDKPMVSYAIEAAVKSGVFDRVCVNSEHEIFRKIVSRHDVDFYHRGESLGSSLAKSDDVVKDYFDNNPDADILVWVNPTSPFQTGSEIAGAVNFFINEKLDSLITVEEKKVHCNFENQPINYSKEGLFAQTQDLTPVNPFVYSVMMWRRSAFIKEYNEKGHALFCGSFGTYPVSKLTSLIIKDESDLMMADYLMRSRNMDNGAYELRYDELVANEE
jgi:CMP-N-acetylneuraminic acid synthetase